MIRLLQQINFYRFLFYLVPLFFLFGCKKETVEIAQPSLNYFPTEKGIWVEYSVDSIVHLENDNNNDDSVKHFQFEVREEIDSSFLDGSNRVQQIVKRYYRNDASAEWNLINVWTQLLTSASAYRTENNISIHKLAFPISSDIIWNGNDSNTEDEVLFSYEYFHEPDVYNEMQFDSTLSVLQMDEDNYIEKLFGREVYATGVGLVFKQVDNLGKINGIVVSGYEYRMEIINYGKN